MAPLLRALAVLPEDLGSILSNHMAAHNCNSTSRESDTFTQICVICKQTTLKIHVF